MTRVHARAATLLTVSLTAAGCGSGGSASTGTGAGASTAASTAGSGASPTSSTAGSASTSTGAGGGGALSRWPDTTAAIGVLVDELPTSMTAAEQMFAATHFVGSQKLTLEVSAPLRALNPGFLVLHYHLAIWQSAPDVHFIVDGKTWGNDYPTVSMNEGWFWHNQQAQRITAPDQKLLMNLADASFAAYWESSLEAQVAAGQYDGIFADSASPSLLQGWVGSEDARLAGTGARDTPIAEWGGKTYIQQWQAWISALNDDLAAKGIPLIPNTSAFTTSWDDTDYSLTAGIFSEGFADPSFAESDWKASTNELLALAAKGKIMILQNYLDDPGQVDRRLYFLANYLLVKGQRSYLDYFAAGALEWYPEWALDLGAPKSTAATVDDLLSSGVYRRDFAKGVVLVNPSTSPVTVTLGATMKQVVPQGGGPIDVPASIDTTPVTAVTVAANGAAILLL